MMLVDYDAHRRRLKEKVDKRSALEVRGWMMAMILNDDDDADDDENDNDDNNDEDSDDDE